MLSGSKSQRPAIGISLSRNEADAIGDSDDHLNAAFLAMTLKRSSCTGPIYFLNCGGAQALRDEFDMTGLDVPLVQPHDVTHDLDIVIEVGAQLPVTWLRHMKRLGKRLIAFHDGRTYSRLCEAAMFSKPATRVFNGAPFDEVWIPSHGKKVNAQLLRTITRKPVYVVPHVWSPYFLDQRVARLADAAGRFGYRPGRRPWRLAIFERNVSVMETCHYPMLVCEESYRARPGAVERMFVVDSMHLKTHATFVHFANNLDLVREHKATFEPPMNVPECMAYHADAVVSHHWEHPRSYTYYEVLHGGYPLIHNSTMLGDAGYYYPDFDSEAGSRALLDAWRHHDEKLAVYRQKAGALLKSVSIDNQANLGAYVRRIADRSLPEGANGDYGP